MPHLDAACAHTSARRQGYPWLKLAGLAALCGPQLVSAWCPSPATDGDDAWLALPHRPQDTSGSRMLLGAAPTPPLPVAVAAASATTTAATSYSEEPQTGDSAYQYVSESAGDQLYSSGKPQLSDFLQGNEGDCYFAASLAATLMSDRDFLAGGLIGKGHGSTGNQYQVRFFYNGVAEWYGLDDRFPETSFGTRLGYQQPIINGRAVAGPALWEKGWVKFNDAHPDVLNKGVKGYPAINGGHGTEALAAITNKTTSYVSPTDGQLLQKLAPVNQGRVNALFAFVTADAVSKLPGYDAGCTCARLSDGTVVTQDGSGQIKVQPARGPALSLVDDHMYAVAAVFTNNDTVRLFNPWGSNPGASGAVVDVAVSTLGQVGSYAVIADSTKKNGGGLSGGAIGGIVGGTVGGLIILGGLTWCGVRRHRKHKAAAAQPRRAYGRDVAHAAPGARPYFHWPRIDLADLTEAEAGPAPLPPEGPARR